MPRFDPTNHARASTLAQRQLSVFEPHLGDETLEAVARAFDERWLGMGSATREFESAIAEFLSVGVREVVATNTGTSALHLALLAAGAGPGVEVIVASFNYVADHQAITATGATPVFCDIEPDTLGLDPERIGDLVNERTGVLLPLHFSGIPCRIDEIYEVASRHGLRVVEDATHAFGTAANGRRVGSSGDLICFSFDPVKVITSVDGGAVVFPDAGDAAGARVRRSLGVDRDRLDPRRRERPWDYDVKVPGFRYHLSNVLARIGLSQLERVDEFIANRQSYCRRYQRLLAGVDGMRTPQSDYEEVSPFIYWVRVEDGRRPALIDHLRARGVETGVHFMPAHSYSLYRDCPRGELRVTEQVSSEVLTLPLHSFMHEDDIDYVCEAIADFFA